jgi:hypothetical protein
LWPASFGLFACLDFGPHPLFLFLFIKFGRVSSFIWQNFLCHELFWLSRQNLAGFIFTENESKIMRTHALLLVENA